MNRSTNFNSPKNLFLSFSLHTSFTHSYFAQAPATLLLLQLFDRHWAGIKSSRFVHTYTKGIAWTNKNKLQLPGTPRARMHNIDRHPWVVRVLLNAGLTCKLFNLKNYFIHTTATLLTSSMEHVRRTERKVPAWGFPSSTTNHEPDIQWSSLEIVFVTTEQVITTNLN